MEKILLDLLLLCLGGLFSMEVIEDIKQYLSLKSQKERILKSIPSNPKNDLAIEFELAEQIIHGTAQLKLGYNRQDGTFTATLTFTDPIDGAVYHFSETSSGLQDAINKVVMDYVHLLESQLPYDKPLP